ncbi:MAG: LysR family transcriptional regulator [Hyphomicrobiales bacterium]|nr:MAG: LysR family transcriptional regulator [Hyphomicrobiales bacterium]
MKLRQLQFAAAVAAHRSFSKAARECHATQPTLSNAIAQLEEELGGRLFTRTTRQVDLTPFGAYMLPFVQAVLDAGAEMSEAAAAYHNPVHKLLRIGLSPLVDVKLLNRILQPYARRHPDVSLFFKECLLDDLSRRLGANVIDIAVVPQGVEDGPFATCGFYDDELYYLPCDGGSEPAPSGPVRLTNLPDVPVIMTGGGCGLNGALQNLFDGEGARLRAYPGQAISYQVIEDWAGLGIGAGILPGAKLSADRERACPLLMNDGRPAAFSFGWIWPETARPSAHIGEFLDYIQGTVPSLVAGGAEAAAPGQAAAS